MGRVVIRRAESRGRASCSAVAIVAALTAAVAFGVVAQSARASVSVYPATYSGTVTHVETWHDTSIGALDDGDVTETFTVTFSHLTTDKSSGLLHYDHATGSWTVFATTTGTIREIDPYGPLGSYIFADCSGSGSVTSAIAGGELSILPSGYVAYSFQVKAPGQYSSSCTDPNGASSATTAVLDPFYFGGGFSSVGQTVNGNRTGRGQYDNKLGWAAHDNTADETWNFVAQYMQKPDPKAQQAEIDKMTKAKQFFEERAASLTPIPLCVATKRACSRAQAQAKAIGKLDDEIDTLMAAQAQELIKDMQRMIDDPPQANYRHLPVVKRSSVPRITTTSPSLRPVALAATALLSSQSHYADVIAAMTQALERAQGATDASDQVWTAKQMRAAAGFAQSASAALKSQASLRARLASAIKAAKLPYRLSATSVRALQANVKRHGLPSDLRRALTKLGWSRSDLANMRKNIQQAPAKAIDEVAMLRDPAWAHADAGMRGALLAWAQDVTANIQS